MDNTTMTSADQVQHTPPRRRVIAALLGVSAAAAGAALTTGGGRTAHANDGAHNFTSADPDATLHADNTAGGDALKGTNDSSGATGNGVVGIRDGSGAGDGLRAHRLGTGVGHAIQASSNTSADNSHGIRVKRVGLGANSHGIAAARVGAGSGDAVRADRTESGDGSAMVAQRWGTGAGHGLAAGNATAADNGHAIRAERNYGGSGDGVQGLREGAGAGNGVYGLRTTDGPGTGVFGQAAGRGNTGVRALAGDTGADALRVEGRSRFSTVGTGTFAAGASLASVLTPMVTADSHITVTLTGNPNAQVAVSWVSRAPGAGFRVLLTGNVAAATTFTYLIVEPI